MYMETSVILTLLYENKKIKVKVQTSDFLLLSDDVATWVPLVAKDPLAGSG